MTHFASNEMLGEAQRCCHEVRFETRRCVKIRLQPCPGQALGEAYSAPPSFRIAAFGEGNWEVEWKRARGGKGMEGEGNEGGRENLKGEDGMEFRVCVRHWLWG